MVARLPATLDQQQGLAGEHQERSGEALDMVARWGLTPLAT
jgi:hypothetical protein